MKSRLRLLFPLLLPLGLALNASAQDLQRGIRNYQDVLNGRKKFEQLSPQERQEVLIIARRLRPERSGKSSACRDAKQQAESAANDLADRARMLRNCAESQDYDDDCGTEFRRARDAHSEYESAVSSVQSECN